MSTVLDPIVLRDVTKVCTVRKVTHATQSDCNWDLYNLTGPCVNFSRFSPTYSLETWVTFVLVFATINNLFARSPGRYVCALPQIFALQLDSQSSIFQTFMRYTGYSVLFDSCFPRVSRDVTSGHTNFRGQGSEHARCGYKTM